MTGPGPIQDMTCDQIRDLAGAFVLGALSPAEADAVRAHLDSCDEAHAEIRELGGALPVLNESVPVVEPPAGLKSRIMAAAAADLAARQGD
jgi:anti-sigma factor RsiW